MRAWEEFLIEQERELGSQVVEKWLRPIQITRFDAVNLYLEAPNSFVAVWFEEHIRHKTQKKFLSNNKKPIKIHLAVTKIGQGAEAGPNDKPLRPPVALGAFKFAFNEISPECTFQNFVPSKSNLLAYKLLCETSGFTPKAESSDIAPLKFNPIYLFGRSGVGKTHLMMATAHALLQQGLKVLYVKAETFTEHVVNAIRAGEIQAFRKAYRTADALFIDDVEIFARKGATQEELFHTFNTLHVEGKQLILSANSSPQELKFIESRLVSRFEWGIVIPLQSIEKEALQKILLQKTTQAQFPLHESVMQFLLETFNNTKTLLRALEALILRNHLHQSLGKSAPLPLALPIVKKYLSDLIQEEEKSLLTPSKIIKTVAEYYGIRIDDILSKSQNRESVLPRQMSMYLCRHQLNLPYMKIGDIFSRDHSTVIASVKQIQKSLEIKDEEIFGPLHSILKQLDCY